VWRQARSCRVVMHPECAGLPGVPEGDWFCPEHAAQAADATAKAFSAKAVPKGGKKGAKEGAAGAKPKDKKTKKLVGNGQEAGPREPGKTFAHCWVTHPSTWVLCAHIVAAVPDDFRVCQPSCKIAMLYVRQLVADSQSRSPSTERTHARTLSCSRVWRCCVCCLAQVFEVCCSAERGPCHLLQVRSRVARAGA
jgi:hypothetical protein